MSVIVSTEVNGNYEPSEGEIIEYGKWLGMKLPEDNPFLWIAREGLKAPLPENWKACQSDKGELYYFNFKTGKSIWDHPMDEHFKELFKSEKQNPTPRSVAAGAKRKEEPALAAKKEGKAGRGKQATAKAGLSGSSPLHEQEEEEPQGSSAVASAGSPAKVQPLNSLRVKKELPKEMRIEFGKGPSEKKGSQALSAPMAATESNATSAQSGSSEHLSPKTKQKTSREANEDAKMESPASVAARGVKSLRMLSESNRNSPTNVYTGVEASAGIVTSEEKDRISRKAREEMESFKEQIARELQQQREVLQAENAKALKTLREGLEKDKESKIKEIQKQLERSLSERRSSLENDMHTSLEKARREMAAQKAAEVQRLKDSYAAQLEQEKKKLAEELAEKLEEFARAQRGELDEKKEAFLRSARGLEKSVENALQHSCDSIVRTFEESYGTFSKSVASSQNDFALRSIQQKEEAQRELDAQLSGIQGEHQRAIAAETDRFNRQLSEMRAAFAAERVQVSETWKKELEELRVQAAGKMNEQKASMEKAAFAEELASLRASHEEELESLRNELRQKAEEGLRSALTELAAERKSRETACILPQDAQVAPQQQQAESDRPNRQGGSEAVVKPPSLDDNLLRSESAPSDVYAALRDTQTKDIKTAVTEALREMFAESPFTLPSPARGGISVSPHRQEAVASRKPSLSVAAAVGTEGAGVAPLSKVVKSSGIPIPTSFQEQRALVEGERRRVNEGRRFVEAQRKNLEERRQQLRRTRHQWKQDVIAAKEEGVRSSSKRGQLLNKVRLALEEQTRGLEHDEAILHESMSWLQSKEQRLLQLEMQIEELERTRALGDTSTMNCSVDTAALVTGYFKPQRSGAPEQLPCRMSQSLGALSGNLFTPFESPATTPVFSSALSRIERRLDEVTSLINLQKSQPQSVSPLHTQQSGHRRVGLAAPAASQPQSRHRPSRSHSKAADGARESHADPW